jgi:hypothetical protein
MPERFRRSFCRFDVPWSAMSVGLFEEHSHGLSLPMSRFWVAKSALAKGIFPQDKRVDFMYGLRLLFISLAEKSTLKA